MTNAQQWQLPPGADGQPQNFFESWLGNPLAQAGVAMLAGGDPGAAMLLIQRGLEQRKQQQMQTRAIANYEYLVRQGVPHEQALAASFGLQQPGQAEDPNIRTIVGPGGQQRTVQFDPQSGQWVPVDPVGGWETPSATTFPLQDKAPSGYRWKEDGTLEPIPGGPATMPTEGERTSFSFYQRMLHAENLLGTLEQENGVYEPGFWERYGPNILQSAETQQYRNAAEQWIRAKLRRESGAVIGEDEMRTEYSTFFPVPGDSPEVVAQKALARQEAMAAMRQQSGRAASPAGLPSGWTVEEE